MNNPFKGKAFDIEHALIMYARSFATIPAFLIYEDDKIAPMLDQIRHCHIYLIGLTPKTALRAVTQEGQDLVTSLEVLGKGYDLRWPMPAGMTLKGEAETGWYVDDTDGSRSFPNEAMSEVGGSSPIVLREGSLPFGPRPASGAR